MSAAGSWHATDASELKSSKTVEMVDGAGTRSGFPVHIYDNGAYVPQIERGRAAEVCCLLTGRADRTQRNLRPTYQP